MCINKYDINEDNVRHIEGYCLSQGLEIATRIPFDNAVTEAMVQGLPVVEYRDSAVSRQIDLLWRSILRLM